MTVKGFAERLRAARAAANLTQIQVAAALGYRATTIANWERERTEPCATDIARLAALYRVTADWLLTGRPHLEHRFAPSPEPERCAHGVPTRDRCRACEVAVA